MPLRCSSRSRYGDLATQWRSAVGSAVPSPPQWTVELGIGSGRPPVRIHAGDCRMTGKCRRPVGRYEARRLLVGGLRPCAHCRPDT
ncbi:DUF6233 domain-containing protein [Streptomyces sp. NPDC101166]|uniref:DUF6233 domain-containing protein n=1 Tax=Streptomyces sp. NPDC101166 TaxID=3366120 RepID=UPI003829DD30